MDRKQLLRDAMQLASEVRDDCDRDPFEPVDPYLICEKLGVKVSFLGASMEGFYFKGNPGRILLSALRPVARKAFTCAHELGHHCFGHGSTIDQLKEDDRSDSAKPEEVLANGFAASLLMPSTGIRGAFAHRKWNAENCAPVQILTIACQFGVGYATLINHLHFHLKDISSDRLKVLRRWSPIRIRRRLLKDEQDALLIVDHKNEAKSFDVEKGAAILLPSEFMADDDILERLEPHGDYTLFKAARRGQISPKGPGKPFKIRVMPKAYVGSAANRFLEDPDEKD